MTEEKLEPAVQYQLFTGVIELSRILTGYSSYTVSSALVITPGANPVTGGSAEVRLIGDGANTPTFSGFRKSSSSEDYDPTANVVNKVVFYYDGYESFYSITVLV